MSMGFSQSVDEMIEVLGAAKEALREVFSPVVLALASFWESLEHPLPTRAELQAEKRARRQARHYAITHGKHGRKRPK